MTKITTVDELVKKWNFGKSNRMDINDGWAHIVDGLLETWKRNGDGEAIEGFHCKQKFASLRTWTDQVVSPESFDAENLACYEASFTCEYCGGEGEMTTIVTYVAIACNSCAEREREIRKKW